VISFSVCLFKDEQNVFLLRPSIREYFADPFILGVQEDKVYVLLEVYRRFRRKGGIWLLAADFQRKTYCLKPLIEESYHLSYPCVIHKDKQDYVMPESEQVSAQHLYRLEWSQEQLRASKVSYLPGRYVDLTVRRSEKGHYVAQFYNGTSNSNGLLFESEIFLDCGSEIRLGDEVRVKGNRRPGGWTETVAQPFQRSGVDYGSGLDFIDAFGLEISPGVLGLPAIVSLYQHRMHHLNQSYGHLTFDIKEPVTPRFCRESLFGSAALITKKIGMTSLVKSNHGSLA
jgi:hypothetical protein